VDYIFRCTAGIPRAINNLCDNAMLNGFAASEQIISRAMIQEVAETFDVLPRIARVEEREAPARIFPAASRAELWSIGSGNGNGLYPGWPGNGHDHPWERSAFTGMPSAYDSASTAHTAEAASGPALPAGTASRDAGATLGAVGSARAVEFSSREVSAARVEPHLVAITDPRSPECEQFRALRTRLLQAGEREHKRAFVITSAGI